ncbi:MAG: AraC family transcriptional regulator [Anaerolineales bacterium]|nr:AraC family transcriptional regulator [Anaerolineales bacterium]
MSNERFLKHPNLPFAEVRCSKNSGRRYKSHMHKTFSIGAIDRGEVIYQVEGKTAKLRPGSLALINPETLHSCNPAEYSKRSYYVLYLDPGWCLQVQQSLWQLEAFRPVDTILLEDNMIFRQFIDAMESLMGEGELLEKEQILVDLVEKVFMRACRPAAVQRDPLLCIERLKRRLGMELNQDISMREIASQLEANPYTLLRQFKAAAGITPHAYRLNCRIELAKKLLQNGERVSQVALECGFFDQSHFHRHFKAITAVTPKEYQINFIQ